MTNEGYVENAPTLAQPGSALFRYVAKMAAVEYEKKKLGLCLFLVMFMSTGFELHAPLLRAE